MRGALRCLIVLSALTALGMPSCFGESQSTHSTADQSSQCYVDGLRYFNARRYDEAVFLLQQAAQIYPYSAVVHYSLANALVKQNSHDRAVQEYRMAYLLEPAGATAAYCKQALIGYKCVIPDSVEVYEFQRQLRGFSSVTLQTVLPPPVVTLKKSDQQHAADLMNAQVQREKVRYGVGGNSDASLLDVLTRQKLADAEARTNKQLSDLYSPVVEVVDEYGRVTMVRNIWYNPFNWAHPEVLIKPKEAQIRAEGEARKQEIIRAAEVAKNGQSDRLKAKENALDEVAANLTNQIGTTSKSGVQLQARGTNLYVRQYIPFSSQAASNAKSATARIVRANTQPEQSAPPEEGHSKPNVRAQITY